MPDFQPSLFEGTYYRVEQRRDELHEEYFAVVRRAGAEECERHYTPFEANSRAESMERVALTQPSLF